MCSGLGHGVDYGCPQGVVTRDQGAIRINIFCWVPSRMKRADMGGGVGVYFNGNGRVRDLLGLSAVELGGVFDVEGKGYRLGGSSKYI
jgi:hypothetical protein